MRPMEITKWKFIGELTTINDQEDWHDGIKKNIDI